MPSLTKISKFLSLVLRHKPETIGLTLDGAGWVAISKIVDKSRSAGMVLNKAIIWQVVASCDKQRFAISSDRTRIRANQGHSIPVDIFGTPVVPPDLLYHGTARHNLTSILSEGIKRGNRLYVHLSQDKETARRVGQRHGHPIVLAVQTGTMHHNGFRFFLSENGVWLTEYVPGNYVLQEKEKR